MIETRRTTKEEYLADVCLIFQEGDVIKYEGCYITHYGSNGDYKLSDFNIYSHEVNYF